MEGLELLLQPLRQGICAGGAFEVDLLVRVQAPDAPVGEAAPRPPLHLALVLDRSGSMAGAPLHEAKRCAIAVMERLHPKDQLALVTYDNRARVEIPLGAVENRDAFRGKVGRIQPGGNTDLHLGWRTGLEELRRLDGQPGLRRVLLLSDGQANSGVTEPAELAEACAQASRQDIGTSTYGLGLGFGEAVMTAMAKAGQGQAYYGETAEDLLDPFMEEFDLLANLWARQVRLTLTVPAGVTVTHLNKYPMDGAGTWMLPDLALDAEAWAVFRLEGGASLLEGCGPDRPFTLAEASVAWKDAKGHAAAHPAKALALPVLAPEAFAALAADELVARRIGELRAADLQDQAYKACLDDDWDQVRKLLDELRKLAQSNPWTQASLAELEDMAANRDSIRFQKETFFQSARGTGRLAQKLEPLGPDEEAARQSYLRRKPRQGKGEPRKGGDLPGEA